MKSALTFFQIYGIFLMLHWASGLNAQEFYSDINPKKTGSNPYYLTTGDSSFVFFANSRDYGSEVFKSDGTTTGTTIFQDFFPGTGSGSPLDFHISGSDVFMLSLNGNVLEFWYKKITDSNPVFLLSTTSAAFTGNWVRVPEKIDGYVFFHFVNSTGNTELWKTDGTVNNTLLVKDLGANANSGEFQLLNNILYFLSDDGVHGKELWRSDGTENGTYMVKDASANTGFLSPSTLGLIVFQQKLYYSVVQPPSEFEIWVSDGTENGTVLFLDLPSSNLTAAADALYFLANDPATGNELWKYDGINPPAIVKDIVPGNGSVNAGGLTPSGNKLYFYVKNAFFNRSLWVTDGTAGGTVQVKNIDPYSFPSYNYQMISATHDGLFYFVGNDTIHGVELWQTDGTEAGTVMIKDINPGASGSAPQDMIKFGGKIYFSATDGLNGRELYVSDGTADGTTMLAALNPSGSSSSPVNMFVHNDLLLFVAFNDETGFEPWQTNGAPAATSLVADIYPGPTGGVSFFQTSLGNNLFFVANDPVYGNEIWKTDGTTAGTGILKDIRPGLPGSLVEAMVNLGDKIVFSASTSEAGREPWITDGTESGTQLLINLNPGTASSSPYFNYNSFEFNGQKSAIFEARGDNNQSKKLYVTDGSAAGTVALTGSYPSGTFNFVDMVQVENYVLFGNFTAGSSGLWRTDGTPAGTTLVKPFSDISNFGLGMFCRINNEAVFGAPGIGSTSALWKTDGTEAGTQLLAELAPDGGTASIFEILNVADSLVFFSVNSTLENEIELWVTNGTETGTHKVKDIAPAGSSYPRNFAAFSGKLYFNANDGVNGSELWVSDGTEAGTYMVSDIFPGEGSSNPEALKVYKDHLYFSATEGVNGAELWRYTTGSSGVEKVWEDHKMTISPNPSDQNCTLIFEKEGQWQVSIVNPNGVTVARQTINGKSGKLNTGQLPDGIYFIKCGSGRL